MLVPEGGGSIIRFNKGKLAQNSYYSNVYGWDMAQGRDYLVHETRAYYGAYGIAKGDASYLWMVHLMRLFQLISVEEQTAIIM